MPERCFDTECFERFFAEEIVERKNLSPVFTGVLQNSVNTGYSALAAGTSTVR